MFCPTGLDQWLLRSSTPLPHWSKPQATVLAWWSLGMVLAHAGALSAGSALLAEGLQQQDNPVRQRLRAWWYKAATQRGGTRHALRVETCCAPWLGGGLSGGQGTQRALALAATTLGRRCVGLALSVV